MLSGALRAVFAAVLSAASPLFALWFAPPSPPLAPPPAVSVGYLGDIAVASVVRSPHGGGLAIALRFRRHYSASLGPPSLVPVGRSPVSAFTIALDYRAETLLVWADSSGVFARVLPAAGARGLTGAPGPVLTLAPPRRPASLGGPALPPAAPASVVEIAAVFSDDAHSIIAWRSSSVASSGAHLTSIELGLLRVRAAAPPPPTRTPILLERFRDPPSLPSLLGSLRVVRHPSEAVSMTWPGLDLGRLVEYSSPVSLRRGAFSPAVVSAPPAPGRAGGTAAPAAPLH